MNDKQIEAALFRLGALALAMLAAFPAASQQVDAERLDAIAAITEPQSEVQLGIGFLSDSGRRFGLYNGIRDEGVYGSLGVSVMRLDRATGTWLKVTGRDLGLENREVSVDYNRQGDWRLLFGYGRTTRFEPFVVNTGLTGIGGTSVAINGTSIRPVDLQMSRDQYLLGADFAFDKKNSVRLRFSHEDKIGGRLFGRGTISASGAVTAAEFLAEPIDRTTQTLELTFSHVGKTLQLMGGYYGTLFFNHADRLDVSSTSTNALNVATGGVPAFTPMSMPLSNNSHQLFLTGGYSVTPMTRVNFKVAETIARQNEDLISIPSALRLPGSPNSLDGRVDTTLAFLDLTSVEVDRLDLQGTVRYEDRDDKTAENKYMLGAADGAVGAVPNQTYSGNTGFNKPRSWRSLRTKLEAGYALPDQYKVVATADLDQQRRNAPEQYRKVNFRMETDELTQRLELRRPVLDTMSGSLSYLLAKRTGSAYLLDTYDMNGAAAGAPPSGLVNPLLWADRDRHAWKASINWTPADDVTVYLVHETAKDVYSGLALGPRNGARYFNSVDASFAIADRWRAHLWWSRDDTHADQATRVNPVNPPASLAGQIWQANIRQTSEGVGAGVQGKTRGGIELGVDVSYSDQSNHHPMSPLTGTNPIASLPDYAIRLTEVKVFGVYPVDLMSGIRAEYAFSDWKSNDWTWNGWVYSDGTTLTQDYRQRTHFFGASYYYRWQ